MGEAPPSPGIRGDALGQGPQRARCRPSEHLLCGTTGTAARGCRFSGAPRGALGTAGCFPARCPGVTPLHREAISAAGPVGRSRRRRAERWGSLRDAPGAAAVPVPRGCRGGGQCWLTRGAGAVLGVHVCLFVWEATSRGQQALAGLAAASIYGRPGGSGRGASAPPQPAHGAAPAPGAADSLPRRPGGTGQLPPPCRGAGGSRGAVWVTAAIGRGVGGGAETGRRSSHTWHLPRSAALLPGIGALGVHPGHSPPLSQSQSAEPPGVSEGFTDATAATAAGNPQPPPPRAGTAR